MNTTGANGHNVAVVGATGAVGTVMLEILEQRKFPVKQLIPLASSRSEGKVIRFNAQSIAVQNLAKFDFSNARLALFSAGGATSLQYAPIAAESGCTVIDNSSAFRYEDDIPLVVPEVNEADLDYHQDRNIIANPNCSTIQMLVALKPIHDAVGITRINVATYQSVSGSGQRAVEELAGQTAKLLSGQSIKPEVFTKQIAFNVIPHIDEFLDNGYTKEEMKMVWETRKILGDENIMVNATAARVPVFYGHSEAVHIETREPISVEQTRKILRKAPGVKLLDQRKNGGYPTPVTDSANKDDVYVGRIRKDITHANGMNMWIVGDNIRKGAALNAVQIAECLLKTYI